MMISSGNENDSGNTLALNAVTKVPVSAAIAAPKAKLISFSELTGIPITSAASGVLAQRPPGAARAREVDEAQRHENDDEHGQDDVEVGGVEDPPSFETGSAWPKKLNGSTSEIPFAPPVTLRPNRSSPFVVTVRKSWRKKSVTIAR